MLSNGNFKKISGCLLQNCLKLAINLSIDIREGKRDWKHQYIIYGKLAFNSCYSCIENFNACLWGVCELHVLTACIWISLLPAHSVTSGRCNGKIVDDRIPVLFTPQSTALLVMHTSIVQTLWGFCEEVDNMCNKAIIMALCARMIQIIM